MQAQTLRKLRDGAAFAICFAGILVDNQQRAIRKAATLENTLEVVQRVARQYQNQTAKLAKMLRRASQQQMLRAIWDFVYQHIQYKLDEPGFEQVRRPARLWADRATGGDCEDYSVFISSILLNLGIPHKLRIADYGRGWQHIYVVVPKPGIPLSRALTKRSDYTVIDDVKDAFDDEHPFTNFKDFPMQLTEMSGLGSLGATPRSLDELELSGYGVSQGGIIGALEAQDLGALITGASGLVFSLSGLEDGLGAVPSGPAQIVLTYPSASGNVIGVDQYGGLYDGGKPGMSGLGWFGGKLFKKISNAVQKPLNVVNKVPFFKKFADTVGATVVNAGLAAATFGLVNGQTIKNIGNGQDPLTALMNTNGGEPPQIDPSNEVQAGAAVGTPNQVFSVVPAAPQVQVPQNTWQPPRQLPAYATRPAPPALLPQQPYYDNGGNLRAPDGTVLTPSSNGPDKPNTPAPVWYQQPAVLAVGAGVVLGGLYLATRPATSAPRAVAGLGSVPKKRKKTATSSTKSSKGGKRGSTFKMTPLR